MCSNRTYALCLHQFYSTREPRRDRNTDAGGGTTPCMHVVVNAAMSVDGKLSSRRREQIAISGDEDFDRVDRIRAAADGIVVGIGTVLADDPISRLT